MFARKKVRIEWKCLEGAFKKPRRLHLVKGGDGLEHCPVTGCEHPGFTSQRGCRKHVKTIHGWYYYFDEKPTACPSPFAIDQAKEKVCRQPVPGCSTDNDFARSFSQWLRSSGGGGKSSKQSDSSVTRALKFLKFCSDENGGAEEDVINSPNLIDYALGSPHLLTKFVDSLKDKWGIGQSGQIAYVASISDLLDFRKFDRPPASVLQNFAVTEVYVKRARKCLAKNMRANWTTELGIENLESRRSWASLAEIQSVIPFHRERYESVLENCMSSPSSVAPADVTFATRFVAAYLFLKVKGCRPMTYQHLTIRMFESAKKNQGMVDQKIFKTAKKYGFDSVYLDEDTIEMLNKYITYVRPLLAPSCDYVLVNRNGKQFQKLTHLLSVLVFEAIGKYIHPTRYRQIIETESAQLLLPNEQKWISEDQKHSSNVARVHYQKKRSRQVALRGRQCMEKLVVESKNLDEELQRKPAAADCVHEQAPIASTSEITPRQKRHCFTREEDNCIKLGIELFGLCWTKILRHSDFHFNACRVPNSLRKRAEVLHLV